MRRTPRLLEVTNLGVVEYEDGLALQEMLRLSVGGGELPEQLLLLEHPPVVTFGRNAGEANLLFSEAELRARGVEVHRTGRGGDVTFHGPGQIVGYPILDLNPDRRDVRRYVRDLEEAIIRALADFGVEAGRVEGLTGVWVDDRKIAAIGVRISRWVTTHGFALNVATDLEFFRLIVPCGIRGRGVTSLTHVLGRPVRPEEVRPRLAKHLGEVYNRRLGERAIDEQTVQVLVWRRISRGGEVLLLRRRPERGGFWQPVTGRIEEGENPTQAAAREVREETGLEGEIVSLEFVRDFPIGKEWVEELRAREDPHPWVLREHAFAMECKGERVRLSPEEHVEYLWTAPERAEELVAWNGNRKALRRLERKLAP